MIKKIKKGSMIYEYDLSKHLERGMFIRDLENGFKELK